MTDKCMKYYYPDESDIQELNLSCSSRDFSNLNNKNFTNENLLNFINEKYSKPFPVDKNPFSFKEDYITAKYDNLCSTSSYSLKPQQKFIGQLVNPNSNINNILINHGLGSGKTCTSLLIGEAFANVRNRETLYVVPAALEEQYIDEIIGEIKDRSIQSCTSMCLVYDNAESKYLRSFYTTIQGKLLLNQTKTKLEKAYTQKQDITKQLKVVKDKREEVALNKGLEKINITIRQLEMNIKTKEDQILLKVSKVFTITTHEKFINRLMKFTDSQQILLKEYLQPGSSLFKDNTTLCIDEIQNLISAGGVRYKILYNSIKYYINPKVRKVFLSATPIYDNAFELALTINLLQPRVPFPTTPELFYNMFVGKIEEKEDGSIVCEQRKLGERLDYYNSCLINQELFKYMCSGYVSYFKGGNPVAYPYKRIIELYHVLEEDHLKHYVSSLKKDVIQDLYRVMGKLNKTGEVTSSKKFEGIIVNEHSESEASGTLTHARQGINISFPKGLLYDEQEEIGDLTETERAKFVIKQNKQLLKNSLVGTNDEVMRKLSTISSKIKSVIDISLSVEGTVFVYSNWLGYGVEAISAVLDTLGYSKFPRSGDPYKTYFVWSPSVEADKEVIKKAKQTFNSPDNSDGKLIKFMLGTASIKEGVSFKNLAQIHLLDPWWNNSRIEQIIARGFRLCSHTDLPPDKRHTDVFKHVGIFDTYYTDNENPEISAMFEEIYDEFVRKKKISINLPPNIDPVIRNLLIKEDKSIIKQAIRYVFGALEWTKYISIDQKIIATANDKSILNNKFERELKSAGLDCELFKNGNLIRLEENIKQIAPNVYQLYYKNPSTLVNYAREGIPDIINFNDIITRKYSYPNTADFPVKFTRTEFEDGKFIVLPGEEEILDSTTLTNDLVMNEDITCWNNPSTLNDIPVTDSKIKEYVQNKYESNLLLSKIRVHFLGQIQDTTNNGIKFTENDRLKRLRIINCYKSILLDPTLDKTTRIKIQKYTNLFKGFEELDVKILKIAKTFNMTKESDIKNLYELAIKNPEAIDRQFRLIES